jgi:hypothetical protein
MSNTAGEENPGMKKNANPTSDPIVPGANGEKPE